MNGSRFALVSLLAVLILTVALAAGCAAKAPTIIAISPATGAPSSSVTIVGSSFGKTQGKGSVKFGTTNADVRSWSDTGITVVIPIDLKDGDYGVTVTTGGGSSKVKTFTIKSEQTPNPKPQTQPQTQNTQQDAITQYMQSQGSSISDYNLKNTKTSASDPSWAVYDYQKFEGMGHLVFLVHKVNGQWTVVAMGDGEPLNPQAHGAPADLTYP